MTPREIIAEAWAITIRERMLRRWGFLAALFETLRNVELLLYQAYYLYWYMKGITVGWLSVEVLLFERLPFWFFLTLTGFILLLLILQLFVPTLATGALIGLAAKARRRDPLKGGFVLALYNFFPILEIHGLFVLSSFPVVLTVTSMLLRYGDGTGAIKYWAMGLIGFLWLVASLFRFFASFSEEGVVIRKRGVFVAIGRSFKLIVSNLSHIVFLLLLLLVIALRILINVVMVFLLPMIAVGVGLLLTMVLSPAISYTIAAILGLALLVLMSYFFAYLQVFKQTVWTLTYLELDARKDVDVILE